jgi:hypothetical protein
VYGDPASHHTFTDSASMQHISEDHYAKRATNGRQDQRLDRPWKRSSSPRFSKLETYTLRRSQRVPGEGRTCHEVYVPGDSAPGGQRRWRWPLHAARENAGLHSCKSPNAGAYACHHVLEDAEAHARERWRRWLCYPSLSGRCRPRTSRFAPTERSELEQTALQRDIQVIGDDEAAQESFE